MSQLYAAPLYFMGPFLIGLLAWRLTGARWRALWIGMPLFLLSQLLMSILLVALGLTGKLFSAELAANMVIVGGWLAAGLCEESCRVLGLWWLSKKGPVTDRTGFMYAIGHSGMETIVVGAGVLFVVFLPASLYQHVPQAEEMVEAVKSISTAMAVIYALHRLLFGLLIHSTYTALVVRYVRKGPLLWLLAAMGLHAVNNAVASAFSEQLAEPLFLGGYSVGLIVVYGSILLALRRAAPVTAECV